MGTTSRRLLLWSARNSRHPGQCVHRRLRPRRIQPGRAILRGAPRLPRSSHSKRRAPGSGGRIMAVGVDRGHCIHRSCRAVRGDDGQGSPGLGARHLGSAHGRRSRCSCGAGAVGARGTHREPTHEGGLRAEQDIHVAKPRSPGSPFSTEARKKTRVVSPTRCCCLGALTAAA